jgi:hypothetical protein
VNISIHLCQTDLNFFYNSTYYIENLLTKYTQTCIYFWFSQLSKVQIKLRICPSHFIYIYNGSYADISLNLLVTNTNTFYHRPNFNLRTDSYLYALNNCGVYCYAPGCPSVCSSVWYQVFIFEPVKGNCNFLAEILTRIRVFSRSCDLSQVKVTLSYFVSVSKFCVRCRVIITRALYYNGLYMFLKNLPVTLFANNALIKLV